MNIKCLFFGHKRERVVVQRTEFTELFFDDLCVRCEKVEDQFPPGFYNAFVRGESNET